MTLSPITQEFLLLDALDILGTYLSDSSVSPLVKQFIGMLLQIIIRSITVGNWLIGPFSLAIDEPYCSGELTNFHLIGLRVLNLILLVYRNLLWHCFSRESNNNSFAIIRSDYKVLRAGHQVQERSCTRIWSHWHEAYQGCDRADFSDAF